MQQTLTSQPQAIIYSLFGQGGPCVVLLQAQDPTTGAGFDAPLGSLGLFQDPVGSTGRLYVKTSASPTGWTLK